MSEIIGKVRGLIEAGRAKEAAAYVKKLGPVPLSEPIARQLLSLLADAILDGASRPAGAAGRFDPDPFATAAVEHAFADKVQALRDSGHTRTKAIEIAASEGVEVFGKIHHAGDKAIEKHYDKRRAKPAK